MLKWKQTSRQKFLIFGAKSDKLHCKIWPKRWVHSSFEDHMGIFYHAPRASQLAILRLFRLCSSYKYAPMLLEIGVYLTYLLAQVSLWRKLARNSKNQTLVIWHYNTCSRHFQSTRGLFFSSFEFSPTSANVAPISTGEKISALRLSPWKKHHSEYIHLGV